MLKPKRMTRVMIAGTKDIMEPTLSELHRLNILHITDYLEENEDFKIGKPLKNASRHSEHLLSLRTIANQLGVAGKESPRRQSAKELPSEIDEKITKLQRDVATKFNELRSIEFKIKEKQDLISAVRPFLGLPLSLDSYHGYETIKVYTGFIGIDLEQKISDVTKNFELYTGEFEKRQIFALFIPRAFEEDVQKILQDERTYVEIKVPELIGNPPVILDELNKDVSVLNEKHVSINSELASIKKDYSEFITAADEYLSIETQKAEAPLRFATSPNAFIIDGWIPSNQYSEIESELQKSTGGQIYFTRLEEEGKEKEKPI